MDVVMDSPSLTVSALTSALTDLTDTLSHCRWCKIVPNIVFFLNQQFITWDAVVGHGNYNVIT